MAWSRRWRINSREKWLRILAHLRDFGPDFRRHPLELIVREEITPKSDAQRALFHAVCEDVGPLIGYTPGEFKDEVKRQWFGDGWQRMSTEDLPHEHYGHMIDLAYRIASWNEIYLPDRRSR